MRFKQRYNLQQRKNMFQKQMVSHPQKTVIIVQKQPKSKLPELTNPKFLCDKNLSFNVIANMLQNRIKQVAFSKGQNFTNQVLFFFINQNIPNRGQTMQKIYQRFKDEDGFLYLQYGEMEKFSSSFRMCFIVLIILAIVAYFGSMLFGLQNVKQDRGL